MLTKDIFFVKVDNCDAKKNNYIDYLYSDCSGQFDHIYLKIKE